MLINFTFFILNTHEYVVNYIQGNSYQKLLIISESYHTTQKIKRVLIGVVNHIFH